MCFQMTGITSERLLTMHTTLLHITQHKNNISYYILLHKQSTQFYMQKFNENRNSTPSGPENLQHFFLQPGSSFREIHVDYVDFLPGLGWRFRSHNL